ncbi:MAG: tetratricopeptide repeat protein, partial [Deltaproteobacteria bacterium]|nr:tetratricopeptide repeat protein [Deltaproteobacteria bacterium]
MEIKKFKIKIVKPKNHTLRRYGVIVSRVILLSFICSFLTGCAVEKGNVYEKDGRLYGTTDGLFKAKWDDYYHRGGHSYGEGGFWEDASADFRKALQKRGRDQRRARTYGMHFIDYFPNRELGIAYFNLGKFKEAMQLLEASLASVESARA